MTRESMSDAAQPEAGASPRPRPKPLAKPATIYDVARSAGVSHQTVSRYVAGYEGIRPATKQRVEAALVELDYRVNFTARALRTQRSQRVAALTHDLSQVGPSMTAQGAIVAAREAGYLLDLVALDFMDRQAIDRVLDTLAAQDLAGAVSLSVTDEMAAALENPRLRCPVYLTGENDDDADAAAPYTQHSVGMRLSVDYLVSLGHSQFFYISGPQTWRSARNRRAAYYRETTRLQLTCVGEASGDWTPRSGFDAIVASPKIKDATALVVANDQMALGALLALAEQGLRVPEDISVVGFDDIAESSFFRPPLTTVHQDFAGEGRAAFARLLGLMEPGRHPAVPADTVHLVLRQSTGHASS
ncbi:LacI family DNA-binding transcriptional regulator (plasmid) [Coraliomargarita sp. W4R53]